MQLPERLKSMVGSVVIDLVALGVLLILKDKGAVSSSVFFFIMLTLVCTTGRYLVGSYS